MEIAFKELPNAIYDFLLLDFPKRHPIIGGAKPSCDKFDPV